MKLKKRIQQDLKSAVIERLELKTSVLRQLLAVILNKEKEKRYRLKEEAQLGEEEIIEAVSSEAKKRKESIQEFGKGKRLDLVEKEKKELEILKEYLPEQLPEEEIKKLAKQAIEKTDAQEIKDMGRVMAELMPQIKGKADGSLVSKIIKELLYDRG